MKLIVENWKKYLNEGMSYTIPVEWLTREVLDDVANSYANSYETQSLPKSELGGIIWDKLHDMGVEEISPNIENFKNGSRLHRWIVLDAFNSAKSIAQGARGKAALAATRSWLANPSEENRRATRRAIIDFVDHAQSTGGYTAYHAAFATLPADYLNAAAKAATTITAALQLYPGDRANPFMRFRVLAVLDEKGILPEPKV